MVEMVIILPGEDKYIQSCRIYFSFTSCSYFEIHVVLCWAIAKNHHEGFV